MHPPALALETVDSFCSYGKTLDINDPHFVDFAKRTGLRVIQRSAKLQSLFSTVCGWHIVYYMLMRYKRRSLEITYAAFTKMYLIMIILLLGFQKCFYKVIN